ncbi:MAG TPA: NAD-dependent epimerase/dehydratase family protein [bacterium]|nr:NAD-dependent epimerase/dehydratase family protein [bacterium]HXK92361.1 NAD-dependent epimerase/dehydratase family protein [bacterium]
MTLNVLITGSSGQIGTNLALRLLNEGHGVLGVDIRPNTWTNEIPTRLVDLTTDCVGRLLELIRGFGIQLLVHLAAHAKVFELVREPSRALENVNMTFKTAESARLAQIPIIFGSSREVYGDIHRHVTDESCADFVVAESPYSASKIAGEAFIYSYAQCYGLPYIVFRFSNVYGRYDNDLERMERVTPLFIKRISQGLPIVIHGREKILDFTYIDDCVDGICLGIEKLLANEVRNQTINLACGEGNSLEQLARLIGQHTGREPIITFTPSQPGEVTRYIADITKARKLLGYNPRTSLEEGIAKAIAWTREFGQKA